MPHVNVTYEMFLPGGHHRQPRNISIQLDLAPTAGGDVLNPGVYTPPFFPQLPYTLNGGGGMARLLFWSVTDGTNGQVLPPAAFDQAVGAYPLTITAWYFPTSGAGIGNGSEIIDDAFSANLGRFIDDTFVDITSDPTLTTNANVTGVVPTNVAETMVAKNSVLSTPEPFAQWILNDGLMPVGTTALNVAKGTSGIAIAIYQQPHSNVTKFPNQYTIYNPWWWIETHGGLVPPGPPPTWLLELVGALTLGATAERVSPQLRSSVLKVALQQVSLTATAIKKEIKAPQKTQVATQ